MHMGKHLYPIALLVLGLVVEANSQASRVPGADWMHPASPEEAGWSAKNLAGIRDYIEEIG